MKTRAGVPVCHVITQLELGGAQENTLHTVAHLGTPYRPSLVCGAGGLLDDEARRLRDVPVTFLPHLVRPIRPLSDLAAVRELSALFVREQPLIVHTHSSKAGILGRLAAHLAEVPVVIHSIHGFGFNDMQPWPLRALLVSLERLLAPLTTHFIGVSQANLQRAEALGIVPPGRSTLIRSGLPVDEFRRAAADPTARQALRDELRLPGNTPLIGMVACLKPQKAPADFIDMAARVAASRPAAHFVLAGDGELRDALQRRIEERGLAGRAHLLGWRRDVPRLMAALDVMVLTSLWEGLPKVIPQAFAAGVPVVATAVDGTLDVVRDGDTGILASPGDIAALADGVLRLLADPLFGRALVGRAAALLPEFDIDAMVRRQEGLYAELLARRGLDPLPRHRPAAAAANS